IQFGFVNCESLYDPMHHPTRGPRNQQQFDEKVAEIADAIKRACTRNPHLIGLCELGSSAAGEAVGNTLSKSRYEPIWEPAIPADPNDPNTGILILYDRSRLK